MRFLMLTSFYPPHAFGGDATYVRQLAAALARRGHEVRVVYCADAYRMSGGLFPREAAPDLGPDSGPDLGPGSGRVTVRKLASRFGRLTALVSQQTGRPGLKAAALAGELACGWDVVHFHNVSLIGGPALLAQSRAPVTLLTAHDHWLICATHILWKNAEKACDGRSCLTCQIRSGKPPQLWRLGRGMARGLAGVDRIFAPSAFTRDTLRDQGIDRPMTILPNFAPAGFDVLTPAPDLASDLQSEPPRPEFLYVGRVTASKGIGLLAELFRQRPGYDLRIIGDGDLLEPLRARMAGVANVQFTGRLPQAELRAAYRRATALMLPSLAPETFGMTTIEAFSQATPAIVRDAGGAGEAVRASGGGFVYRTDADCLAAMDRLAGDAALRAGMGRAARLAYVARFREEDHLAAYLAQIAEIGAEKGVR